MFVTPSCSLNRRGKIRRQVMSLTQECADPQKVEEELSARSLPPPRSSGTRSNLFLHLIETLGPVLGFACSRRNSGWVWCLSQSVPGVKLTVTHCHVVRRIRTTTATVPRTSSNNCTRKTNPRCHWNQILWSSTMPSAT